MTRFGLLLGCSVASVVGGIIGVSMGIRFETPLIPLAIAFLLTPVVLALIGLRSFPQLLKVAAYSITGWGLCFGLGPATSETTSGRAQRIAADSLAGKGWYVPCAFVSGLMAFVGTAFVPIGESEKTGDKDS